MFWKTQFKKLIWQPNVYNARGQVTDYLLGNNYRTLKSFNNYGFTEQILTQTTGSSPNNIQNEGYNFDELKGNLMSRINHWPYDKTENFTYDNLNRLTNENVVNGTQLTTLFAPNGNISQKTDIGTYTYGDAGPHAVTGLTSTTGTLLPVNDQIVDYTAFNKASHIGQGGYDYFITYGTDRQRSMSRLINGITEDILQTKYYAFGDYEKEISPSGTRQLHYIYGGDGLAAIYVKYNYAPDSLYFIVNDHLGSLVGAINSTTGTIYRQNFDAWGRKRNPQTWSYTNIPDFPFDRGYTGHEHLKWFGLINMNGRMYDPALCRFLSPDPFVQHPGYSQSYNRYTYCLNNPLKYTDPSGFTYKPSDWDAPVIASGYYFGAGVVGPTIGWIDHDVNYSYVYKRLLGMPSGSGYTSESGFSTYTGGYGGVDVGIAYQAYHNSWGNTNAGSANAYISEYNNTLEAQYNSLSNLNNQLLASTTTGLDFFYGDPPGVIMDYGKAPWMNIALKEEGVCEFPKGVNSSRIIGYFEATDLSGETGTVKWGWCSAFANWVMSSAGYTGTKSGKAESWLTWGNTLSQPEYGCITVTLRDGQYHVGFYIGIGKQDGFINLYGGNQTDKVGNLDFYYTTDDVQRYAWPKP